MINVFSSFIESVQFRSLSLDEKSVFILRKNLKDLTVGRPASLSIYSLKDPGDLELFMDWRVCGVLQSYCEGNVKRKRLIIPG